MDDKELRQYAKKLKIRNWHNKKIENIKKEIASMEGEKDDSIKLDTSDDKTGYLDRCGYNTKALQQYAKELGATSIVYKRRYNVFNCYKEDQLIDEVSMSMF